MNKMPASTIDISRFLELRNELPVLDVRSPGEYLHAHIPGAYSLPLFSDEERKIVGTTYKQKSREQAIKAGLDFFRMRPMLEEAEKIINQHAKPEGTYEKAVIVHCWRGGMRSAAVAWLLDLYGFRVYLLKGGYKSFRRWALDQFIKTYDFQILGGYTGRGKILILNQLKQSGHQVLDLECLANHKGSAFGSLGQAPQPSQEMFENSIALALNSFDDATPVWVEDESQRIGALTIPHAFWKELRQHPVSFLEIPFEKRLEYIISGYGGFETSKLIESVLRIQKRLGPRETKDTISFLVEDNIREAFAILLKYYDKVYDKALMNRNNAGEKINKLACSGVDISENSRKLITCVQKLASPSS